MPMDHSQLSAQTFDKIADKYQEKFMDLTLYDASYQRFCQALRPGPASVLDAACGPGNVARYLLSQRPELELLGIDLAPRMVELAWAAVPSGRFEVHDCREMATLGQRFDGIVCAFGLLYLSPQETEALIAAAAKILLADGVLYLSAMLGKPEDASYHQVPSGDRVYINYHRLEHLSDALIAQGFSILLQQELASPATAGLVTRDGILIAQRSGAIFLP